MRYVSCVFILLIGGLLSGCSEVQQEANAEAARIADHVVPDELNEALASRDAETPRERAAAARDWLSEADEILADSQGGTTLVVQESEGSLMHVAVYHRWESGSFFPPDEGESAWGVACRSYDVAEKVESKDIVCPEDTPKVP